MAEHNTTGKTGEDIAAEYLKSIGYQILFLNKRFGKAEIDIIARIGAETVFVEVKTRKDTYFGLPEESVSERKIELMAEAAEVFQAEVDENADIRFDLISILLNESGHQINHIEDAFFPGSELF